MKNAIIACILLILILTAIIVNGIFNNKIVNELEAICNSLPAEDQFEGNLQSYDNEIENLVKHWEKASIFFSISKHYSDIENATYIVLEMESSLKNNAYTEFCIAKNKFLDILKHLNNSEKPTFENIF